MELVRHYGRHCRALWTSQRLDLHPRASRAASHPGGDTFSQQQDQPELAAEGRASTHVTAQLFVGRHKVAAGRCVEGSQRCFFSRRLSARSTLRGWTLIPKRS